MTEQLTYQRDAALLYDVKVTDIKRGTVTIRHAPDLASAITLASRITLGHRFPNVRVVIEPARVP